MEVALGAVEQHRTGRRSLALLATKAQAVEAALGAMKQHWTGHRHRPVVAPEAPVGLATWTRRGLHFHRHRHLQLRSVGVAARNWCITTLWLARVASSPRRAAQATAVTTVTRGTEGPPAGELAHRQCQQKALELRNNHRFQLHVNPLTVGIHRRRSRSGLSRVAPLCRRVGLGTHRHHRAATPCNTQGLLQALVRSLQVLEKGHSITSAELVATMATVHCRTPEAASAAVHCHAPEAHRPIIVQRYSPSVRLTASRACHGGSRACHMRQWLPYQALRRQTSLPVAARSVLLQDCHLASHRLHQPCSSGVDVTRGGTAYSMNMDSHEIVPPQAALQVLRLPRTCEAPLAITYFPQLHALRLGMC